MSAERKLAQIYELESAISTLRDILNDLQAYDIHSFSSAGSHQWAGSKQGQFISKHDNAKSHLSQAKSEAEQAINDCKSKQSSLLWSIDGLKHPIIFAEAMTVAYSY